MITNSQDSRHVSVESFASFGLSFTYVLFAPAPNKKTFSVPVGMSQTCQRETSPLPCQSKQSTGVLKLASPRPRGRFAGCKAFDGVPLPCPASGWEQGYAMNLLAPALVIIAGQVRWRNESGGRCCGLGHIGEHIASICRRDRQIRVSPLRWRYIFLPLLARYRSGQPCNCF
jgi:hypothetical protein